MIRVGIIGCGSITKYRHAPEFKENLDSQITGFYDVKKERAEEMVGLFGGKVYTSIKEMLTDTNIDAVSICTSNKYHKEITIDALEKGKHVLCEKPMATSVEDGIKMIEKAKEVGKTLMVAHNQRLAPAHAKAKEILKSGELGRVLTFRTSFSHRGPEYWTADKSTNTWFFKKDDAFVGAMGDLGVHKADIIRWLIDDEIEEVSAFISTRDKKNHEGELIEVDDNAVCILKSKSGIIGTLAAGWTNYGGEDHSTVLFCSEGVMRIYDNPDYPIEVIKKNGDKILYKIGKIVTNDEQVKTGIIDIFVNSILKDEIPEIPADEGLAAIKIILACVEANKTGKTVKVN